MAAPPFKKKRLLKRIQKIKTKTFTVYDLVNKEGVTFSAVTQLLVKLRNDGSVKRINPDVQGRGVKAVFALTKKGRLAQ